MEVTKLRSIPELVDSAAASFGASPALLDHRPGGRSLSFVDLAASMRSGAALLRAIDPVERATALMLLEPRADWFAAFASILRAHRIAVPLTHDTPAEFVKTIARATASRVAIVSDATSASLNGLDGVRPIHVDELLAIPAHAPDSAGADSPSIASEDLALLAFTSGSTQLPRAVELTHHNLLSNLNGLLTIRGGGPGDAMLSMLPPAHLFALVAGTLAPLAVGARIVYPTTLLPNRLVDTLRDCRISHALAVPALADCLYREVLEQLIDVGLATPELRRQRSAEARAVVNSTDAGQWLTIREAIRQRIGERFESLVIGGAAVDPDLVAVISAVGIRVELGYGLTEAGPIVAVGIAGECPPRSVGRAIPGVELRVDDSGEILVRGPSVMRGYYRDPAATADVLADGWLRTGDRGRLDDDQNLFVLGRVKEAMVTSSGRTIYPEDVEPYYASPLFAEHAVIGVPDGDGNDAPMLFVVPRSPSTGREELARAFETLQASAPAPLRVTEFTILQTPLPRTASGKVRRRAIIEAYLQRKDLR